MNLSALLLNTCPTTHEIDTTEQIRFGQQGMDEPGSAVWIKFTVSNLSIQSGYLQQETIALEPAIVRLEEGGSSSAHQFHRISLIVNA